MLARFTKHVNLRVGAFSALVLLVCTAVPGAVQALGSPDPTQSQSVGVEGRISAEPPAHAPTITAPANGQVFSTTPITVSGFCDKGLLVKVFSNNVFVGAAACTSGSYSVKVDIFNGKNDLVTRLYDSLDQAGPDSNVVSVRFNDAQFAAFGSRVSLNSSYARRGAAPGSELVWPLAISGGKAPYAVSVDWGDGTDPSLQSLSFAGDFTASHVWL